jgi:type I restriction enzyme S subunit
MKTIKNLKADEIRKSIFQLAIQGKLVKQDLNDEPASELVKRIYAEKQKLIKEGKIKKDKNESYIFKGDDNCYYEKIGNNAPAKLEDLPFDIPDSWTWIRLKSFANIYNGNSINEEEKVKKYMGIVGRDFIATKDVNFDRTISYNNGVNIPYDSSFRIAPAGKVLLCIEGGSAGRKIAITDRDVCFGNKLACFDTILINDLYLYNILQSNEFLAIFKSSISGIIGGVSINTLKDFIIPIPPFNEQERIVNKINSCEPLLKDYELAESKLTSLESEFPEKLKKSILQYAIEGKLVKQDPNDEPASVLLERIKIEKEKLIKEGKIKRDKNESYIYQGDDKNYYENLPLGWECTTLSKVISLVSGTDLKPEDYSSSNIGIPYITGASNITENNEILINRFTNKKYINSKQNDILLSCKGTVGKIVINNIGDIHIARQFMGIKSFVNREFLIIYLKALISKLVSEAKSIIPGIDRSQILTKEMLLPPENEQLRISNKVNVILAQINN